MLSVRGLMTSIYSLEMTLAGFPREFVKPVEHLSQTN